MLKLKVELISQQEQQLVFNTLRVREGAKQNQPILQVSCDYHWKAHVNGWQGMGLCSLCHIYVLHLNCST